MKRTFPRTSFLLGVCALVWCVACPHPLLADNGRTRDAIIGLWVVAEKDAYIEIYRRDGAYFGRIAWLREDNNPNTGSQVTASDSRMYEEPRIGMLILRNFRFNGQDWEDGTLYDPTDGKTYKGVLTLDRKGMLHVRGFVGIRLLGKTTVWQRLR